MMINPIEIITSYLIENSDILIKNVKDKENKMINVTADTIEKYMEQQEKFIFELENYKINDEYQKVIDLVFDNIVEKNRAEECYAELIKKLKPLIDDRNDELEGIFNLIKTLKYGRLLNIKEQTKIECLIKFLHCSTADRYKNYIETYFRYGVFGVPPEHVDYVKECLNRNKERLDIENKRLQKEIEESDAWLRKLNKLKEQFKIKYTDDYKFLNKLCLDNGYIFKRQTGSHRIFENNQGDIQIIPQHKIGVGLFHSIVNSIQFIRIGVVNNG